MRASLCYSLRLVATAVTGSVSDFFTARAYIFLVSRVCFEDWLFGGW